MLKEKERKTASGFTYLVLLIVVFAACIWGMITLAQPAVAEANVGWLMALAFVLVLDVLCIKGLCGVQPTQGAFLQLFGLYLGAERPPGVLRSKPFASQVYGWVRIHDS